MTRQGKLIKPGEPDMPESTTVAFFRYLLASPAVFLLVHLLLLPVCRPTLHPGELIQCSAPGFSQLIPPIITLAVIGLQATMFHFLKASEFGHWWAVCLGTWLLVFFLGYAAASILMPSLLLIAGSEVTENGMKLFWYPSILAVAVATVRYPFQIASRPTRMAALQARERERVKLEAKAAKAEQKKVDRQKRHKPTRDAIRWGLAEVFSRIGAIDGESGLLLPEATLECPKCLGAVTANDIMEAIYSVEKALNPKHKEWLAASRSVPPRYKPTDFAKNGKLKSQAEPQYAPSALQGVLGCTASEAKAYLAAAGKLRFEKVDVPPCQDCVVGKPRATGRRPMAPRLRRDVLFRDRFTCQECGANRGDDPDLILHVDHIQPVAAGGQDEMDNLQVLCIDCNLGKSDDSSYM